ncbi:hypothetical protein [Moorena producens]|uniref:hypothetical protein n=1 Tax=Moorena producens TaxID=1155739 RepID=UPI003C7409C2
MMETPCSLAASLFAHPTSSDGALRGGLFQAGTKRRKIRASPPLTHPTQLPTPYSLLPIPYSLLPVPYINL